MISASEAYALTIDNIYTPIERQIRSAVDSGRFSITVRAASSENLSTVAGVLTSLGYSVRIDWPDSKLIIAWSKK